MAEPRSRRAASSVSYVEPDEDEFDEQRPSRRARTDASGNSTGVRSSTRPSPLDAVRCERTQVPGAPSSLQYSIGGPECGGSEGERVLREVEIDENAILQRLAFAGCRRILLYRDGRVVAAAVAEMHSGVGVLELPIVATLRSSRQQGNGGVLVALIMELAATHLQAKVLMVSATMESRRFWMSQGLHAQNLSPPPVAQALRALSQSGPRYGFFETTQMARMLPSFHESGDLVRAAVKRAGQRSAVSRGMGAARAAELAGYEELPAGTPSFTTTTEPDGTIVRYPVDYGSTEAKRIAVPASRLQAFSRSEGGGGPLGATPTAWGDAEWGVRCTVPISKGQIVCEIVGEYHYGEAARESLAPRQRFVVALDDRAAKKSAMAEAAFVDMTDAGTIARLVSTCAEAPNLELLVCSPELPERSATSCAACNGAHRAHTCGRSMAAKYMPESMPAAALKPTPAVSKPAEPTHPAAVPIEVSPVSQRPAEGTPSTADLSADALNADPSESTHDPTARADAPEQGGESMAAAACVAPDAISRKPVHAVDDDEPAAPRPTGTEGSTELAPPAITASISGAMSEELTDAKLYPGAYAKGWRIIAKDDNGHFHYRISTHRFTSRREALLFDEDPNSELVGSRGAEARETHDPTLRGAFFGGKRLTGPRADGLVHVQYSMLYESTHTDAPLCEWVVPSDEDAVRPVPPPCPDRFHESLAAGDHVELWHEAGWWPVKIAAVASAPPLPAFDVTSDSFPGLCRRVSATQIRPRWRWAGEGTGWKHLTRAAST